MRRLAVAAGLVASLAAVPGAGAKGIESADGCGVTACRSERDRATLERLFVLGRRVSPPAPGPFYRVRLNVTVPGNVVLSARARQVARESWLLVYLPSAGAVRRTDVDGGRTWLGLDPAERRAFERVTAGLRPLPARGIDARRGPLPVAAAGISASAQRPVLLSEA